MMEELNKFFEEEESKKKYNILKSEDLFNKSKINFFYNLFQYIFKDNFFISQNTFLSELRKNIINILRKENFPPNHLCLEITERCRLLNMDLLKNIVVNLRGRGVLMALDDFGTGFSSVGLVKNLEFDVIKIDRSFVLKIEEDEKERKLIEHFVGLGSIFGASICVEGIETSQMRDVLKKYGVSGFQGYYYSKPILIDDLLKWKDPD
jgi:EAL domain-containing protein (putative c-di-GMP-specific phosphodiesterase class I)